MKTQTVQIEWHEEKLPSEGWYLIDSGMHVSIQRFITEKEVSMINSGHALIKRWANPIEYKPDDINTVELLEQAARELGGLIHLFNIRAKNDDVELLDFQTVDELQQLAVKITLNKLEQGR